ncbi:MAG: site-specific integrase [Pseudomonadota bacterium]
MATIEKRETESGVVYRVKVRIKGRPNQTATFARITDAKKWAQITEGYIKDGKHFHNTEAKKRTLNELIDKYIKNVLPLKPKAESKQKTQLEWWKKQIGSYSLCDITPALIAEQRDNLLLTPIVSRSLKKSKPRDKKRSPSTVVRYMAALSHVLSTGCKEWGWIDDNPMRKVTKPKEARGRIRFLSDNERIDLLDACKQSSNACLYTVVVLALSTGMRYGEIINLKWEDVDTKNFRITLHETKNGERRVVPLVGHALELVTELKLNRDKATNLLFPASKPKRDNQSQVTYKSMFLRKAWMQATKEAELKDFRFHDLRHSAASYLAMNGASLAEIAEVLGHKTLQMVKRYAHLSEAHTSKVVASMNERIFG